jgi:serine/threonine protein kinase
MLYCSNPTCSNPFCPDGNKFCLSCGSQTLSPLFRNRYRVIQLLGEGGFGRTYEAIDTDRMDDPCVIKQFFPQVQGTAALEKATELFKQEAKRLYELGEHPQIPRLIAHFEQDKRLYLVQELIEGQTLLAELQQQGAFSEEKIRQLLADLLPVLKVVHERGVIHRDIKPENIMRRRKDGKLMLIDFGVSKQVTATLLGQAGTTVGTHGYAPLEQMRGQVYPASDLYSLGVTCIRLLTQSLPQEEGSDDLYDGQEGCWIWREHLPRSTTISSTLSQVLDKLLQDKLKNRYQSANEVMQELKSTTSSSSTRIPGTDNSLRPNNLNSAVGINYRKLRDLLAARKWREADEETRSVILQVANREQIGWLNLAEIKEFPCEDLRTIDQLWVTYSNGHFGFSIQKQIWQEVGGKPNADDQIWCSFGERVGWRVKGDWLWSDNLAFTSNAPKGHLPGFGVKKGWLLSWSVLAGWELLSRIEACGL